MINFRLTAEERIETEQAQDHSRAQALRNLRTARAYSKWIKFVRLAVHIRIQRVVSRYWGQLGSIHLRAGGFQIYYNWASQHWGRLGGRLRKHSKFLKTLQ